MDFLQVPLLSVEWDKTFFRQFQQDVIGASSSEIQICWLVYNLNYPLRLMQGKVVPDSGGICSCLAMLLSTQSVNVAMLMATYGVAGGFGMGLVYLGSVPNLNPASNRSKQL